MQEGIGSQLTREIIHVRFSWDWTIWKAQGQTIKTKTFPLG